MFKKIRESLARKLADYGFNYIIKNVKKSIAAAKDHETGTLFTHFKDARLNTMYPEHLELVYLPVDLYTQDGHKYWLVNKETGVIEHIGRIDTWGLKQTIDVDLRLCREFTNLIIAIYRGDEEFVERMRKVPDITLTLMEQMKAMMKIQQYEKKKEKEKTA
jgi:hypothetical protein